jgi:DUF1009 family protein
MAKGRSLELYGNSRGDKPMTLLKRLGDEELPDSLSEADVTRAIETAVAALNSFPRLIDSQVVVVEDGLIIAVEGLTTRNLVWCN